MEILQAKTADLIPYGFNNRDHSQQQIDRIANSINEFGFNQPIVVDEQNIVLVGHGRLEAAKKLGLEDVPVLKKIGLSETQKKAYRILDNKLQNDSTWNAESLEIELAALEEADFDFGAFGLDEFAKLFSEEKTAKEDDFEPREVKETIVKLNDILELGDHRLMCGDSTKAEDVERLMDGQRADLMLTDPPYNVDYTGKTEDALKVANDSMADGDFRKFLLACFGAAFDALKPGGPFYVFHAPSEGFNFHGAIHDCQQKVRQCLVWAKDTLVMGRQDYQWQHEPCLYGWKAVRMQTKRRGCVGLYQHNGSACRCRQGDRHLVKAPPTSPLRAGLWDFGPLSRYNSGKTRKMLGYSP